MSLFSSAILTSGALKRPLCVITSIAGLKNLKMPPTYDHIVLPEKPRLPYVEKVPPFIGSAKMPRTTKELNLMRGPEEIHTNLIHNQYGIMAMRGGRLNFRHFETIRFVVFKKMDQKKAFAIWRVDPPWLPVTKKGLGQRGGGGKGSIDHYVTPVKEGRIILEVGGHCEYKEVLPMLKRICQTTPFPSIPVNQEVLDKIKREEEKERTENTNPYNFEYLVKNNMGNCRHWIKGRVDYHFFGKYL